MAPARGVPPVARLALFAGTLPFAHGADNYAERILRHQRGAKTGKDLVGRQLGKISLGDNYDIHVELYQDVNCRETAGELLLKPYACYANKMGNASVAYSLSIETYRWPQSILIDQYEDDCFTEALPQLNATAGACAQFVGTMYGVFSLRQQSQTCTEDCSNLVTVTQRFFLRPGCEGHAFRRISNPAGGVCVRGLNGTETFEVNGNNLTHVLFGGSDVCDGGYRESYQAIPGHCYSIFVETSDPEMAQSFRWDVDGGLEPFQVAACHRGHLRWVLGLLLLAGARALVRAL